ncbi:MAG: bifunctional demethylmenaquinone methyltransferase/2-methoxy-6-polyprenyl-1,4-benzoquinol methylase UbiE [Verrucomicrobiota bacterium]
MASKYYVEGTKRASKVEDLFAAVAPRYDLINDIQSLGMHRLWKRQLVEAARPAPGDVALDLCCGTGDVAFALADRGAVVTGIDFSAAMLDVARRRPGRPSVTFVQGDAMALPVADASADVVTVAYGLRNVADIPRALAEWRRVLRPGGRLVVLEFGKPPGRAWRWFYFQYLQWVVPVFGRLFCGDADTHGYILESLLRYPGQRGIDEQLRALGFRDTRVVDLMGGAMSLNIATR